jgi:hypothetical protein
VSVLAVFGLIACGEQDPRAVAEARARAREQVKAEMSAAVTWPCVPEEVMLHAMSYGVGFPPGLPGKCPSSGRTMGLTFKVEAVPGGR